MSTTKKYLAHAKSENGDVQRHELEEHLRKVATLAENFATPFGAKNWAYIAGIWHDLGKYRPAFQAHIKRGTGLDADEYM